MHLSSCLVKSVIYLYQHRSVHDIRRHDVCGSRFNAVTPFETTTTWLKNSEGCMQNERKVVDLPTDILVQGGTFLWVCLLFDYVWVDAADIYFCVQWLSGLLVCSTVCHRIAGNHGRIIFFELASLVLSCLHRFAQCMSPPLWSRM